MIGIFDSGVGGLSIYKALRAELPQADFLYIADQKYAPYGSRSSKEIIERSELIVKYLIAEKCEVIVIACNTATACAIDTLRELYPHYPFIGVEPGIKPAVTLTKNQKVGVLATQATLKSERYQTLKKTLGKHVSFYEDPCVGLVNAIEKNKNITNTLMPIVEKLKNEKVDTVVLGCTHFPFVEKEIQDILPQLQIVNPAAAIAAQVARLTTKKKENSKFVMRTTGNLAHLDNFLARNEIVPSKISRIVLS